LVSALGALKPLELLGLVLVLELVSRFQLEELVRCHSLSLLQLLHLHLDPQLVLVLVRYSVALELFRFLLLDLELEV
tara:strand:+ start:3239 stop:3469 length:231 start_codon:yes stop_codon:yes gene_type:complete